MSRWIVRNAVQTPECGNGIWARTWTRPGALRVLHRILRFEFGKHCIGCYSIPAGGLVVVRSSQAFNRLAAQPEAGER